MYGYSDLLDDVNYLARHGVETGSIGASEDGRLIPYVHLGTHEGPQLLITGAIHAREHVTAHLMVRQIYAQLNATQPLSGGLYFVPMVNPDGNVLIGAGADAFPARKAFLLRVNGGNPDFSLWKANVNAVDLNVNFDARWGTGKHNVRLPAPSDYIGTRPFCQSESAALAAFTQKVRPQMTVSYHALGQEIYWEFYQPPADLARDRKLATAAARMTGYRLIEGTLGSAGGYKDWCIAQLRIPALTVEVVSERFCHPLPDESLTPDLAVNRHLPRKLLALVAHTYKDQEA